MGLPNYLVAEAVDTAAIVIWQVLVVRVVMADYLLAEAVVVETLPLLLAEQAVMAVTVWFVFILGNQL
jgi:hypothetical protein